MNLEERLEKATSSGTTWKPTQEGERLIGTILELGEINNQFGGTSRYIKVQDESGDVWHVWATATISSALDRQKAEVGDRIGLKLLPKVPGKRYRNIVCILEKRAKTQEPY